MFRKTLLLLIFVQGPLMGLNAGEAGGEVTLQQVLAEPDNAALNYRYALSQVSRGELLSALSALERVIAAEPGNYEAMLVHALVLYRLENLEGATGELEALERLPLTAGLRGEIRALRVKIRRRLSTVQFGGQLGAGYERNSNRKSYPSSGKASLFGRPISVDAGPHKADDNLVLTGGLSGRQDLGSQKGHELSESFTYYRTEQKNVRDLNLDAYSFQVSGRYRAVPTDIVLSLLYDDLRLARDKYLESPGAGLRLERQASRAGVYLAGKHTKQKFSRNRIAMGARDRDGGQTEALLGGDYQATPSMKIGLEYGYAYKYAADKVYTFARNSLGVSHVWFLGGGMFLESSVNCSLERYPHANTFVSRRVRKDMLLRGSISYGLPLGFISRHLNNFLASVTGELQDSRSNIINYTYKNYKFGALLTYKWQAGF